MQVEVPPWVTQWLSAAEWRRRQRERDRRLPGLTLYAYGPYGRDAPNPVQPIFRFGGFPEGRDVPRFGAGAPTGLGAGQGAGVNTAGGWVPLHYPLDPFLAHNPGDLSHLPISVPDSRQRLNVEWVPPGTARPASGPAEGGLLSGRAALRAWVFGSALIVLVLVLVRAIDKCLTINLLKSRRRRSQEWPTPNVRATNRQDTDISTVMIPGPEGNEPHPANYSDVLSIDLPPPPYSECTATSSSSHFAPSTSHKLPDYEDPPPAYSDTYVEFSNKNGIPSVLIYSRRRTPLVNRRDIVSSDDSASDDGASASELSALNTNIENNGDVHRGVAEETDEARNVECDRNNVNYIETVDVNDATTNPIDENDTENANTNSSNSNTANIDADGNGTKDGEIMV